MKISTPQHLHIEDFNYPLPDDRIAKYPLENRDMSKLLVYKGGNIEEKVFSEIAGFLPANSLMIFNNTKVIQARLYFRKQTGAQIEIFCLEPYIPHDYALIFQQTQKCSWVCMIGNLKKWKDGELAKTVYIDDNEIVVTAKRIQSVSDSHIVEFAWNNSSYTFSELLENGGELPIPPYLNRNTEEKDKETYQTLYSKIKGSVAAPTAGLHFTENVFASLKNKGIDIDEVTLHVGAGTFKPVKSDTIADHTMHNEFIAVGINIIRNLIQHNGKVIAVGTTSVRTLESLYYIGSMLEDNMDAELIVSQWQPYDEKNNIIPVKKALQNITEYLEKNNTETLFADTSIMIAPGYDFKIVDGIVTNFHQPKSTLLLLVSAFVEGNWRNIYNYALSHGFRFLSYGDSSLLLRD